MTEDETMQRLLVGDLDPESEQARAFFEKHPGAREDLDAMRALERGIANAGLDRVADVEMASRLAGPASSRLEALIESQLAGLPTQDEPKPTAQDLPPVPEMKSSFWGARGAAIAGWLVAAAAVMLIWFWPSEPSGPSLPPDPGPLLGGQLRLVRPLGATPRAGEFAWDYQLEGSQYFQVLIVDPDAPFDPVDASPELDQNRWQPDPDRVRSWPNPFEWQVHVMTDGATERFESAQVQLQSP